MNMINIAKLGIAIGKYVSGNPELILRIVTLTVQAIERISGIEPDGTRGLKEDSVVEHIVSDYNAN